jgi:hypothetical protein
MRSRSHLHRKAGSNLRRNVQRRPRGRSSRVRPVRRLRDVGLRLLCHRQGNDIRSTGRHRMGHVLQLDAVSIYCRDNIIIINLVVLSITKFSKCKRDKRRNCTKLSKVIGWRLRRVLGEPQGAVTRLALSSSISHYARKTPLMCVAKKHT